MNLKIEIDSEQQGIYRIESREQELLMSKSKNLGVVSLKLTNVVRDLSEASGIRQAIIGIESTRMCDRVDKARQKAIGELLACIEMLGG